MHLVLLLHLKLCQLRNARSRASPETREMIESAIAQMETRLSRMTACDGAGDGVSED
jgi:hypothetical protein